MKSFNKRYSSIRSPSSYGSKVESPRKKEHPLSYGSKVESPCKKEHSSSYGSKVESHGSESGNNSELLLSGIGLQSSYTYRIFYVYMFYDFLYRKPEVE